MRIFAALFLISVAAVAQTRAGSSHPGSEPYTPTRQEWLLLSLVEDKVGYDLGSTGNIQFVFSADDDPETIDVLVTYAKTVTKEDVDNAFAFAVSRIRTHAMHYGWDWVKIRKSEMQMPEIKSPH